MKQRHASGILAVFFCALCFLRCQKEEQAAAAGPGHILLKDFKPVSLHKIPVTIIGRVKFPVIDMHAHGRYAKDRRWLRTRGFSVEKSVPRQRVEVASRGFR